MKVAAVIVLYNPDLFLLDQLLVSLCAQVGNIVLVDNSPKMLDGSLFFNARIHYQHMGSNIGIAKAQNVGVSLAGEVDAIVFFDQDSTLNDDLVFRLSEVLESGVFGGRPIAAVGPLPIQVDCDSGSLNFLGLRAVQQIISSGMLVSSPALKAVGAMECDLFIDAVDHEWCWRAWSMGFCILQDSRCVMLHRQGQGSHTFLGLNYRLSVPFRLYYQFRNVLILCRRGYVPLRWKLIRVLTFPLKFIINVTMHDAKLERAKYMLLGVWHGLLGRSGNL